MDKVLKGKNMVRKRLLLHIGDILNEQGLIDDEENNQLKVLISCKSKQWGGEDDTSRDL